MNALPLQFLMLVFAGWVNRHQHDVIDYLQEENRAIREQLGGKQLRFTDQQCRRLAAKAKAVCRKGLFGIDTLVTPDTLLRWHRQLIARKYDGSRRRRPGRPKTAVEIESMIGAPFWTRAPRAVGWDAPLRLPQSRIVVRLSFGTLRGPG